MEYYKLLGLTREPFSNSPDPAFFFESASHAQCLHRLEIAIRLKRGLNICLGEIGSGKSTLCRVLLQQLAADADMTVHFILDSTFGSPLEFLQVLHRHFLGTASPRDATRWELTDALREHLFREVQDNGKILVLVIDEGQKLSVDCLEVLRELLNYETNNAKLLQVVIFAQNEFQDVLNATPNFTDRINELCQLVPLGFWETVSMIQHRLQLAGTSRSFFTWPAYWAMYKVTGGHPRKIMHLGHHVLLNLIVSNAKQVTKAMVVSRSRFRNTQVRRYVRSRWIVGTLLLGAMVFSPRNLELGMSSMGYPAADTTTHQEYRHPDDFLKQKSSPGNEQADDSS